MHHGIKGFVVDADTNSGIGNAAIKVRGINHTITSQQAGDYWRYLAPGTYDVTAEIQGYALSHSHHDLRSTAMMVGDMILN